MLVRGWGGVASEVGWGTPHFLEKFFATLINQRTLARHKVLWVLETCSSLRCGDLAAVAAVIPQTVRVAFCAGAGAKEWIPYMSSGDLDWT